MADPIDIAVGKRMRDRRVELRLSQKAVAQALGVSFQQVQKYERGANRLAASSLVPLAAFLQTTVAALVGEQVEEPANLTHLSRIYLRLPVTSQECLLKIAQALSELP